MNLTNTIPVATLNPKRKSKKTFIYCLRLKKCPRKFPLYLGLLGLVAYRNDAIKRMAEANPYPWSYELKKTIFNACKIPTLSTDDFVVVRLPNHV